MRADDTPPIPASLGAAARAEAQGILADVSAVRAVVIATADGFDIASSAGGSFDARRIAALASSIAAIGEVVSGEAGLGRSRSVTVNTEQGFAVFHQVPRRDVPIVINVIGGADAVLAQVHWRAAEAARRLAQA
jgi:predicted regulator of Ras-like GTPase activity (Roadblock/LC7/MglB family)